MNLLNANKFFDFACKRLDSRLKDLEKVDKSNRANLKLVNNGIEKIKELMEITSITETYKNSNEPRSIMNEYQQYKETSKYVSNGFLPISPSISNIKNDFNNILRATIIKNLEEHDKKPEASNFNSKYIETLGKDIREKTPTRATHIVQEDNKKKIIKDRTVKSPNSLKIVHRNVNNVNAIHEKSKNDEREEHEYRSRSPIINPIKISYESEPRSIKRTLITKYQPDSRSKSPLIESSNRAGLQGNPNKSPTFHQQKFNPIPINRETISSDQSHIINQRRESANILMMKDNFKFRSPGSLQRKESAKIIITKEANKSSILEKRELTKSKSPNLRTVIENINSTKQITKDKFETRQLPRSKSAISKSTPHIRKVSSQTTDQISNPNKNSEVIPDFWNANAVYKGSSRAMSPILSTPPKKAESYQIGFGRSAMSSQSKTISKSPSGIQVVAVKKTIKKGAENSSAKKVTKSTNQNLENLTSPTSKSGKTLHSISHLYLDADDETIIYIENEKASKNNNSSLNKPAIYKLQNNNVNMRTPKYQADMRSISTIRARNDIEDDDFDLVNQTVDEKAISPEKNELQINVDVPRDYSPQPQCIQPEIMFHSLQKPEQLQNLKQEIVDVDNSFFDVNEDPDEPYIEEDDSKKILPSPKFSSFPQVSNEWARSIIINSNLKLSPVKIMKNEEHIGMMKNIEKTRKSPINNELDKTTNSWALVNGDLNDIDIQLSTNITAKLLEKPEFLSNKRIGAPRM